MSTQWPEETNPAVALTGARGFLGWHTRGALHSNGTSIVPVAVGAEFDVNAAAAALEGAPRLIHIAGVNRGSDDEVREGNVLFANQMSQTLRRVKNPPSAVVFANSTQAGNGSVYGQAKEQAAAILASAAGELGLEFVDVNLPNLFGEHGRPFYNAVTSTFCHTLAEGGHPKVIDDKELTLLHAQNAADLLTGIVPLTRQAELEEQTHVSELLGRLAHFAEVYSSGLIPDLTDPFERDLFNTYRSYAFAVRPEIRLRKNTDPRGSFFEIVRGAGGESQSSFSTTVPGVSRGDHYHRRKIERFTVLAGEATIEVRKLFTNQVLAFHVTGDVPVSIDMPTLWPHRITNTGSQTLFTSFWVNELYNENRPDTVKELV
ncbi:capsular biosynthesis protein [Tessaracoccus sp. ZS01]|uniref:polysaccharide biosynthesis C-terminal domain-containing protein n=1 Tax=Tessaracoccus sp. ZS01 TaxID=1906324 RepID=UPI00096BDAD2|nr:capsular biosynthesis protein [Tessaracoccus sp. ZS01]MCG6568063.1 capsular biosynthesis protein [Tessaracoccus sp. ZS01]OMG54142.1 capsular biosynthesis protein [Tessaracoccus sp. ZS01]